MPKTINFNMLKGVNKMNIRIYNYWFQFLKGLEEECRLGNIRVEFTINQIKYNKINMTQDNLYITDTNSGNSWVFDIKTFENYYCRGDIEIKVIQNK
jgi:hypothetical protein